MMKTWQDVNYRNAPQGVLTRIVRDEEHAQLFNSEGFGMIDGRYVISRFLRVWQRTMILLILKPDSTM